MPPPLTPATSQPGQSRALQPGRQPACLGHRQATSATRIMGPGHSVHAHGAVGGRTHERQPDRHPAPEGGLPPTIPVRGRCCPTLPIRELLPDPREQVHQLLRPRPHRVRTSQSLSQTPYLPSLPSPGAPQARLSSAHNARAPGDAPAGSPPACPEPPRKRRAQKPGQPSPTQPLAPAGRQPTRGSGPASRQHAGATSNLPPADTPADSAHAAAAAWQPASTFTPR